MLKKYTILLCLLLLIGSSLKAEHLAGGKFSYQKINKTTLKILFELERNCGTGGANFESEMRIGIYSKSTDQLVRNQILLRKSIRPSVYPLNCDNLNRCLEVGTFEGLLDITLLNYDSNGYYINWERCCLSNLVMNIVDPGGTPYSAYIEIPSIIVDSNFINCNSPKQSQIFNPLVCVNFPFNYDLHYTDLDGDSLSYRFIVPLAGGYTSQFNPSQNHGPMPYDLITYYPFFNQFNFLNADSVPILNAKTGILSLTPKYAGNFVFCYAVDEFRNGKKIGSLYHQSSLISNICSSYIIEQPQNKYSKINDTVIFKTKHNNSNATLQWVMDNNDGNFINLLGETRDSLVLNILDTSLNYNRFKCIFNIGSCLQETNPVTLYLQSTIGINSQTKQALIVYPNPSNSLVKLSGGNYNSVKVYSLDGKLLIQSDLENIVNISTLEKGIYLIKAEDKYGQTYFAKILKSEE
jgi:hypothetical protein